MLKRKVKSRTLYEPRTKGAALSFGLSATRQVIKKSTGIENFQGAMNAIMGDIKTLAAPTQY